MAIARKGDYEPIRKTKKYNKTTRKYELNKESVREYFKCLISYYSTASKEGFPKVEYHTIDISMPQKYWKDYHETHLRVKASLKRSKDAGDGAEKGEMYVTTMRSKANRSYIESKEKLESPKADWIVNKIKEDPTQKTIVYSFFIESGIEAVQTKLENAEFDPLFSASLFLLKKRQGS